MHKVMYFIKSYNVPYTGLYIDEGTVYLQGTSVICNSLSIKLIHYHSSLLLVGLNFKLHQNP